MPEFKLRISFKANALENILNDFSAMSSSSINDHVEVAKNYLREEQDIAKKESELPYEEQKQIFKCVAAALESLPQKRRLFYMESEEERNNRLDEQCTAFRTKEFEPQLRAMHLMCKEYGAILHAAYWATNDSFAYVYLGNIGKGTIIFNPRAYFDIADSEQYKAMPMGEIRRQIALSSGSETAAGLVPSGKADGLSVNDVIDIKKDAEAKVKELRLEMDDIRNAKTEELAALKAEIDAKVAVLEARKDELLSALEAKKDELEEKVENMKEEIFLLESQIYNIQCYMGEAVSFVKVRSGKNAPDDSPIVIHQKLRFLDEDLGRMASIYQLDWGKIEMFEDFLKYHPEAMETFTPNERCISLVRLSKNNVVYAIQYEKEDYGPIMKAFEYYHGTTVGILIRNGENLYLGWTDNEKVHIKDDLIVEPVKTTEVKPVKNDFYSFPKSEKEKKKEARALRNRILDGMASRSFVYNILQGICDNSDILPLPSGVKLNKQSEYVRYAVADKWIASNPYGTFEDMIERCNSRLTEGDSLLTLLYLRPKTGRYHSNDRGRGYANRTHDCDVKDCTIYPVNLIEYDEPSPYVLYTMKNTGATRFKTHGTRDSVHLSDECTIVGSGEDINRHLYVSIEKYYSDAGARSNIEVYSGEYVNLAYMNSAWLMSCINNKQMGTISIGGEKVDYAHLIRYLKTALDFVKTREEKEKQLLDAVNPDICKTSEWPATLTEWKLSANVRAITQYQAKRFAKYWASLNT